jgi:Tetracyclin repressor-like, C-terminal domain
MRACWRPVSIESRHESQIDHASSPKSITWAAGVTGVYVSAADAALFQEARRLLEQSAIGVPDTDLALWMVSTVSGAVIHRATVERPDDLTSGAIAEELVTLLCRYLRRR